MLQEGTRFFTSESVTEGHPDKVCDQISDAILDAHLAQDPMARVACETIATTGMVLVMGEITSKAKVDYNQIVRDTIARIGYKDGACGFDARTCAVQIVLDQQSPISPWASTTRWKSAAAARATTSARATKA